MKLSAIIQRPATLLVLLTLASILLFVGMILPVMTIKTLVFMRHSFSILSGIYDLFASGKYVLFLLLLVFSVIVPLLKLIFLFALVLGKLNKARTEKYLRLLHDYGRWAMLDVFVVAILVVSVKLRALASVEIHLGFYVFTTAVLLILWTTHQVANISANGS